MSTIFQPAFAEGDTLADVDEVMRTIRRVEGGYEAYPRAGLGIDTPNLPAAVRGCSRKQLRRRVREELDASTRRAWS